jgi:hypothetical protein
MPAMSRSLLLRSAVLQTVEVGVLSAALAIALGSRFFDHWGWVAGPLAWMACSLVTAQLLALPVRRTLLGAILAGLPSIPMVALGLHWPGDVVAIVLFALWCAWTPRRVGAAWST